MRVLNTRILPALDMSTSPSADDPLRYPPVFIVGAPRCGSTLLAQVLTDALDIGYLCNRHCQFFGAPAMADRLFTPLRKKEPSDFQSTNGATRKSYGPNECGDWWYRFFRRDPAYVPREEADPERMRQMRRSIAALTKAQDKPVLMKNLYASVRLQPILTQIPEALIVIIKRNELGNAHSLLEGRKRLYGSYNEWWSVEPPNIESLRPLPPHIQVVEQIRAIYTLIENDLQESGIAASKVIEVTYERLCANVRQTVSEISQFLVENGASVEPLFDVPESFELRNKVRIDQDVYAALEDYVSGE